MAVAWHLEVGEQGGVVGATNDARQLRVWRLLLWRKMALYAQVVGQ